MTKKSRKSGYVDPQVQGQLARRLIIHWLLFTLTAGILAFGMQWLSDPSLPLAQQLEAMWNKFGPILLVLVCLVPIFVYDSIRLSNRFVGPMFRLRKICRELASGQTPGRLQFRGSDFWQDLAGDFNLIIERSSQNGSVSAAGGASRDQVPS